MTSAEQFLFQISSLFLSATLLRAILMNHLARSEASKSAKTAEGNLKIKFDAIENSNAQTSQSYAGTYHSILSEFSFLMTGCLVLVTGSLVK